MVDAAIYCKKRFGDENGRKVLNSMVVRDEKRNQVFLQEAFDYVKELNVKDFKKAIYAVNAGLKQNKDGNLIFDNQRANENLLTYNTQV